MSHVPIADGEGQRRAAGDTQVRIAGRVGHVDRHVARWLGRQLDRERVGSTLAHVHRGRIDDQGLRVVIHFVRRDFNAGQADG